MTNSEKFTIERYFTIDKQERNSTQPHYHIRPVENEHEFVNVIHFQVCETARKCDRLTVKKNYLAATVSCDFACLFILQLKSI